MSHVFLTGFMGAGKSTVGRLVAGRLGREFVDLDVLVSEREGLSVPELFAARGEDGFRKAEHAALESLAVAPDAVVATGGGIVLREDNRSALHRMGTVVYLAVSPESALARLGGAEDRPLLAGRGLSAARDILAARLSLYLATADTAIDTDGRTPEEVAAAVVGSLGAGDAGHDIAVMDPEGAGYRVLVSEGLLADVGRLVRDATSARRVAVVTDSVVEGLYLPGVSSALEAAGLAVSVHVVPSGEASKSWAQAGTLLEDFARAGLDRSSAVVALGGGVVGDLAGFCAATYMRGIAFVQVPTTLLAQVDSAIGGKTAVDLTAGKNLAGAFWQPRLVIADTGVLATLPPAERTNGLVEAVKAAVLEGPAALVSFESRLDDALQGDSRAVRATVADAAAFKARVVSSDPREAAVRECLNLGHTLGHALELRAGFGTLAHGLAVAEGIRFALRLTAQLGEVEDGFGERIAALLERVGAPAADPTLAAVRTAMDAGDVLAAMKGDKKSRDGAVRFVLATAPGVWRVEPVPDDALLRALVSWSAG